MGTSMTITHGASIHGDYPAWYDQPERYESTMPHHPDLWSRFEVFAPLSDSPTATRARLARRGLIVCPGYGTIKVRVGNEVWEILDVR
jgi:hypothetical protein